jgi:hypothetical protein
MFRSRAHAQQRAVRSERQFVVDVYPESSCRQSLAAL